MERPKTQYARLGDLHVAYHTLGQGPPDIVFVAPYISHVEATWEAPSIAPYLRALARIGRLVLFDAIGSGLSDPLPSLKRTLDSWTNDVRVVMDAIGLPRAAIHCIDSAGAMAILFAATYPERVSSLVLVNTCAKALRGDDYLVGAPRGPTRPVRRVVACAMGPGNPATMVHVLVSQQSQLSTPKGK